VDEVNDMCASKGEVDEARLLALESFFCGRLYDGWKEVEKGEEGGCESAKAAAERVLLLFMVVVVVLLLVAAGLLVGLLMGMGMMILLWVGCKGVSLAA